MKNSFDDGIALLVALTAQSAVNTFFEYTNVSAVQVKWLGAS